MRIDKKFLPLVLMLCCQTTVWSAPVTIKLETEQPKSGFLFVMREADPITRQRLLLHKFDMNDAKEFELTFDLDETSLLYLRIGWIEYPFYAEPGANYDMTLPEPGKEVARSFAATAKVPPTFKSIRTDELNYLIAAVNRRYDAFFEEHYMEFAYENLRGNDAWKRNEGERLKKLNWVTENPEIKPVATVRTDSLLLNFSQSLSTEFQAFGSNEYFKTYLRFTLADLDRMRKVGNDAIFKTYFENQAPALNNPAYVYMLEWFNGDFVFRWCEQAQAEEFVQAFETGSFRALDTLFAKTTWYGEEKFRHVSLLLALQRDILIKDKQRLSFLEQAAVICSEPMRSLAKRIFENKTLGQRGEQAPSFTLTDIKGDLKNLTDFTGKHLYINFFASWCSTCMAEMRQIEILRKSYGKHVEFISISMDDQYDDFKSFVLKNRGLNQTFLFGTHDPAFLEKWLIRAIPRYVLLDREGRIIRFEAKSPSEGIEKELEKIKNEAEKKPKSGAWN